MLNWNNLGTGLFTNNTDYFDFAFSLVSQLEGSDPRPYLDTLGIPTIGVGFNLRVDPVREAVINGMGVPTQVNNQPNPDFDQQGASRCRVH